jgi:phosphohistidine phosphatase SixA
MKLILVRHAKAMDRVKALLKGVSDEDRPLTKKGKAKFCEHVKLNQKEFSGTDLFVSSEYLRAKETLELLLQSLPARKTVRPSEVVKKLTPDDSPLHFIKWLKTRKEKKLVVVGHEPFISKFLEKATKKTEFEKLKKGAIISAEIKFSDDHFAIKIEKIIQPVSKPE